ncbi:hypothetical protein [uncultured Winogradskyella sp.]|uniref:hypothetical protein n=1 Tax=uncultured Winogradskyella sp. TaxID=395353 RepID=UPI00260FE6A2|nr:hypothetical protein [uncultured Winogradskyella sp.]
MKHTSLHTYLDEKLCNVDNPSNELIIKLKKDYWKLYYRHYRRHRRKFKKEFTLGFDREYLQLIQEKRGAMGVSEFLYLIVDRELRSDEPLFNDVQLQSELSQQLMELIALVEELLDNDRPKVITDILERLEVLEESFSQFIN